MKAKDQFEYPVHITVDDDGYYAEVPDLPGCSTSADTFEAVISNAQEAVASYLGSLRKHGEPIPTRSRKRVTVKGRLIYTSVRVAAQIRLYLGSDVPPNPPFVKGGMNPPFDKGRMGWI